MEMIACWDTVLTDEEVNLMAEDCVAACFIRPDRLVYWNPSADQRYRNAMEVANGIG